MHNLYKCTACERIIVLHRGHYTGTWTTKVAQSLGHPIWSSEDYSHYDDDNGAGCLARVRKNFIVGLP